MTQAEISQRQEWLGTLAHAPKTLLQEAASRFLPPHRFETLRDVQTGLVMVRGRIGGGGDAFNIGEATVTRCVQRLCDPQGRRCVGVGYRLGRDAELALWIARFDALLQHPAHQGDLLQALIGPLREEVRAARAARSREVASSRVRFQTLDPQEGSG